MLQEAKQALKPGGKVAILDQIAGNIPGTAVNVFIRLIALQYYILEWLFVSPKRRRS